MPAITPILSLIVVTHNSTRWLPAFAASWAAPVHRAPSLAVQILITDTGSTDDSRELAQSLLPDARVFSFDNIGYGAAINRATQSAASDWLLLCNPDLTFSRAFASNLLSKLETRNSKPPAVIAPRLLNPDGSLQPSVGRFPTIGGVLSDQFRKRDRRKYVFPQPESPGSVDWASGACLLVQRKIFLAIGGFDENFFLYVEEVDLQRRLYNAGHSVQFDPELEVTHHNPNALRSPSPGIQGYAAHGLLRYFAKHSPASLPAYRLLALMTRRLTLRQALASRNTILARSTGP